MRSVREIGNAAYKKNVKDALDTLGEVLNLINDKGTTPEYMVDKLVNDLQDACDNLILIYGIQEIKDKID